jgi:hypothetical protein
MNNVRNLVVWLAICSVCAALTIYLVQAVEKPVGLRDMIATFGR